MKCDDFLMLIRHITLWPWPLTRWPWTCIVDAVWCAQSMFQTWAKSVQPRLSYWRLTTYFSSVFRGCSNTAGAVLKRVDRSAPNFVGILPDHLRTPSLTSSSAVAEKPRCRVGQLWPKYNRNAILCTKHCRSRTRSSGNRRECTHQTSLYCTVRKAFQYGEPFKHGLQVSQTDGRTDR